MPIRLELDPQVPWARELAAFFPFEGGEKSLILRWVDHRLALYDESGREYLAALDWDLAWKKLAKEKLKILDHPLARAIGRRKLEHPMVVDSSCGMGDDTLRMLFFGARVIAYERHPLCYALCVDAWKRGKNCPWAQNLEIRFGSYQAEADQQRPDCLYFDPMYNPPSRKSLPKKKIQRLEEIVGTDQDSAQIAAQFLSYQVPRLVIKRSPHAPSLLENVHHQVKSKSCRFDIYLC